MSINDAPTKTVLYITGAGKCGSHLVGSYIASNCSQTYVYPHEFKQWKQQLPSVLNQQTQPYCVFHCPGSEIVAFQQMIPKGQSLMLLRHPVQQYLAWIHALHNRVLNTQSYRFERQDERTIFHEALTRVVHSFYQAPNATHTWKLEAFTSTSAKRQQLTRSILPMVDQPTEKIALRPRANYLDQTQIVPVTATGYIDELAPFELEALEVHDSQFKRYYPNWRESVGISSLPTASILNERSHRVLPNTIRKLTTKRKLKARLSLRRGHFYKAWCWRKSANNYPPVSKLTVSLRQNLEPLAHGFVDFSQTLR